MTDPNLDALREVRSLIGQWRVTEAARAKVRQKIERIANRPEVSPRVHDFLMSPFSPADLKREIDTYSECCASEGEM